MPIKVLVSGTGKMGREVLATACREADLEPVGVLARAAREEYLSLPDGSGLVPFGADPEALLTRTRPDGTQRTFSFRWMFYHLLEHESGHFGQMLLLRHLHQTLNAERT